MARQCASCGKRVTFGNRVSHSNLKTRRRWQPNLRTVHQVVDGKRRRVRLCSRCLRSGKALVAR